MGLREPYFKLERKCEVLGYELGFRIKRRHPEEPLGPHGGGWDWSLGIDKGSTSSMIYLFTWGVRIYYGEA